MRILVTGASGFVGSHVARALSVRHDVLGLSHKKQGNFPFAARSVDITDEHSVSGLFPGSQPEAIVHAAAISRILDCEQDPERAFKVNVDGTVRLIHWSERIHAKLIFISTDQVFSGEKGGYRESDFANPINVYGRTKLEAEAAVLSSTARQAVLRCNSVIGPTLGWGESFSSRLLNTARRGERVSLYEDQYRSPIHIRKLVEIVEAVCLTDFNGLLHVGGKKRMSRLDTGLALLRAQGISSDSVTPTSYLSHPNASILTRDTSFDISRLKQIMPDLEMRSLDEEFGLDVSQTAKRL